MLDYEAVAATMSAHTEDAREGPRRSSRSGSRSSREVEAAPAFISRCIPCDEVGEFRRVILSAKAHVRDGTSHVVLEPLELVEKLAAIVPPRMSGGANF